MANRVEAGGLGRRGGLVVSARRPRPAEAAGDDDDGDPPPGGPRWADGAQGTTTTGALACSLKVRATLPFTMRESGDRPVRATTTA